MKILFVSPENNLYSGAFRSMVRLIELLTEEYGHQCMVVLPCDGDGQNLLDEKGIRHKTIFSDNGIVQLHRRYNPKLRIKKEYLMIKTRLHVRKLVELIQKEQFDLLHINASDAFIGAWAACKTRTPYVWHIREFLEEDHGTMFIHRRMCYSLMQKSNRLIAISYSIRDKYLSIVGEEKITTIFNGIDAEQYVINDHVILKDNHDPVQFLMVGRLEDGKGQLLAIEACAKFHEKHNIPFILNLVGAGHQVFMDRINQKIHELNAHDYVRLCGKSDNTVEYYRKADIFLMCSRAEAFGRVTVEAMMGGCLVIGNNTAGTKDLIEDGVTGLLFEDQNVDDLVRQMEFALENPETAREIAARGRDYMAKNMTAERNAEQVNELYAEILRGGGVICEWLQLLYKLSVCLGFCECLAEEFDIENLNRVGTCLSCNMSSNERRACA